MISFSMTGNIAIVDGRVIKGKREEGRGSYTLFHAFTAPTGEVGGFFYLPKREQMGRTRPYRGRTVLYALEGSCWVEHWSLRPDGFLEVAFTKLEPGKGVEVKDSFVILWREPCKVAYISERLKALDTLPPIEIREGERKATTNIHMLVEEKEAVELPHFMDVFLKHLL